MSPRLVAELVEGVPVRARLSRAPHRLLPADGRGLLVEHRTSPLPIIRTLILHLVYQSILDHAYAEAANWLDDTIDHVDASGYSEQRLRLVAERFPAGSSSR